MDATARLRRLHPPGHRAWVRWRLRKVTPRGTSAEARRALASITYLELAGRGDELRAIADTARDSGLRVAAREVTDGRQAAPATSTA